VQQAHAALDRARSSGGKVCPYVRSWWRVDRPRAVVASTAERKVSDRAVAGGAVPDDEQRATRTMALDVCVERVLAENVVTDG